METIKPSTVGQQQFTREWRFAMESNVNIPKGTRCACASAYHVGNHANTGHSSADPSACQPCTNEAVRMVTVRLNPTADQEAEVLRAGGEVCYSEHIPMCAPCAEYHEREGV